MTKYILDSVHWSTHNQYFLVNSEWFDEIAENDSFTGIGLLVQNDEIHKILYLTECDINRLNHVFIGVDDILNDVKYVIESKKLKLL